MIALNDGSLIVELDETRPCVVGYTIADMGASFGGAGSGSADPKDAGALVVNGVPIPWDRWDVDVRSAADSAVYSLSHQTDGYRLSFAFHVQAKELSLDLAVDEDPRGLLRSIAWQELPLLRCSDRLFRYWIDEKKQMNWSTQAGGGAGLYWGAGESVGLIGEEIPDVAPRTAMHAAVFDGKVCATVRSHFPVLPLLTRFERDSRHPDRSGALSITPNLYSYRVRQKTMPPLHVVVAFFADINGDGVADECDCRLWVNRQLPDPDPLYKERLWYKISCGTIWDGTNTTVAQAREIIEAVSNVTDGMPQVAYLVGWQKDGPGLASGLEPEMNPAVGTREELWELARIAREQYNTILSFHLNVDEAFDPQWDPEVLCRDVDGKPVVWGVIDKRLISESTFPDRDYVDDGSEDFRLTVYHINHTKHVESGRLFPRLDALRRLLPLERTVHLDAFRNTNCSWEPEETIGAVEELECGLKEIVAYFAKHGIDVSTEGINGMPIEDAGIFSAFWHMRPCQMYHGKVLGGGFSSPANTNVDCFTYGFGVSIDTDISYLPHIYSAGAAVPFRYRWLDIVDFIYLGSMLYRFYLDKEMLEYRREGRHVRIRFSDDVAVRIDTGNDRLRVTWQGGTIAEDYDRFVPTSDAIYAYSRDGGERLWQLPQAWRDADLELFCLTRNGRRKAPPFSREGDALRLSMPARTPIKIVRR